MIDRDERLSQHTITVKKNNKEEEENRECLTKQQTGGGHLLRELEALDRL